MRVSSYWGTEIGQEWCYGDTDSVYFSLKRVISLGPYTSICQKIVVCGGKEAAEHLLSQLLIYV